MKKNLKTIKAIIVSLVMGVVFFLANETAQAATTQMLPDTGEEIAKTGAIIGGIILIIVVLIILFRKKKK